ncbi:MAG: S8 family serine peptidase [Bacteroidales bacterium]|nr:S8 family serine peptidase [Bacteroidales bacterium]
MKKVYLLLVSIVITFTVISQVAPDKYLVKFTDKNDSPYSISNPEEFLSQKALDRRTAHGIAIVENDLPVNPQYIESVANTGVTILNSSKWFNGVTIYTTDQGALDIINAFSFVESVEKGGNSNSEIGESLEKEFFANEWITEIPEAGLYKSLTAGNSYEYGAAANQIQMLNGDILHDMGYDGEGMTIAVLDAGFLNVDDLSAFDSLWNNGQILGYKDFVDPINPNIFNSHSHGCMVLSTMGANLPGQMVGTAPQADYWLLRSEDGPTEYLIEEYNWVSAAEFADSVGADIINSSLGYTTFDDFSQNHTYEDMDGNTTPITIGADMAVSKGMIVVNSAGNSGSGAWFYIGAPADGDSVFSIGAVDGSGNIAFFSSNGPTFDGRIKPNVVAQGQGSAIIDPNGGSVTFGSGTSFSSPITAGMVACLWQANPNKRNTEIMEAIQSSGSLANAPTNQMGWGIPDYVAAHSILTIVDYNSELAKSMEVFPNPFTSELNISFERENISINRIELTDVSGKLVFEKDIDQSNSIRLPLNESASVTPGFYLLRVITDNSIFTEKVLKR